MDHAGSMFGVWIRGCSQEGEVAVRCPNKATCGGRNLRKISFFASKNAMDIGHLGPEIVKKLIEIGFCFNPIRPLSIDRKRIGADRRL